MPERGKGQTHLRIEHSSTRGQQLPRLWYESSPLRARGEAAPSAPKEVPYQGGIGSSDRAGDRQASLDGGARDQADLC
jgi:hypothetical protein